MVKGMKDMHNILMTLQDFMVFKRFNFIKVSTLTKKLFTLTKGMGHERHMIFLVGSFDWSDHFDQVLSRTSN
jgi:hypothetical protein